MKQIFNLPLRIACPLPRYAIGTGIQRRIAYKKESTAYVLAGTSLGQVLRRVNFGLATNKDTYTAAEKATHAQDQDMRHGFLSPKGPVSGELSPGTYSDWFDSILRRNRTTVAAITGASFTVAASGSEWTITRAAGSFLTDGIKKGMVVRITAGAFNALNLNKNIVVRLVTATVITGRVLNGSALFAEGPIASATMTIPGKYSYVPASGHTDDTYTIEDYHSVLAVPKSEQFYGCKTNSAKVGIPASGMSTVEWDWLGYNLARANAAYFSAPAAETTTGIVAAATSLMFAGDVGYVNLTNVDFTINGNMAAEPVVGSNVTPAVFPGRVQVVGNFGAFFEDAVLRDAFIDETELGIVVVLASDTLAGGDFISFMMPRAKLTSAGKDDPDTGIKQAVGFKALYNSAGGAGIATEKTTFAYQDSAAT